MDETDADAIARARALGRAEAVDFDRALLETERHAREARIGALSARADGIWTGAEDPRLAAAAHPSEIRELVEFRSAVLRSKGWRFLQWARRLAGRDW